MRPNRARFINRTLAGLTVGALIAAATMPVARADGYLSNAEQAYVDAYGAIAICPVIARYPSEAGVMGVASAIMDEGWSADSTADIVNAAVVQHCPRFWPLLQAIGRAARANNGQAGYRI